MSHRVLRVRELIRRELSMILEKDYAVQGALVTVHDVNLTPDLKQCFVYVGIIGAKGVNKHDVMEKLRHHRAAIQRDLYKRITLKNSPQLLFRLDESVERGVRVLNAIENLPPPAEEAPAAEHVNPEQWEDWADEHPK